MDYHKLLIDVVSHGLPMETRIHNVECANGHVCGYARVPVAIEDPAHQIVLSVHCSECGAGATIGSLLGADKTKAKTKLGATAKPASYSSSKSPEPPPKVDRKADVRKAAINNMAVARAIKAENQLKAWEKTALAIDLQWKDYSATKPGGAAKALEALLRQYPNKGRGSIDSVAIYMGCWLAWECWKETFIAELASRWGFTEPALRSRVESVWSILQDATRLKMPFMAKACKAPRFWLSKLEKAQDKAQTKTAEKAPEPKKEPDGSDWRTAQKMEAHRDKK